MLITIIENKYGERLNLTQSPCYDVFVTGLTPAGATINTSKIANMDGTVFNSSSINERNIVLTIIPKGNIEKSRINLYRYIKSKQYIKIYFKNGARDVYIEGCVENVDGDLFTQKQKIQVSVLCPNPFFKDIKEILYTFSNTVSSFEFEIALDETGVALSEMSVFTMINVFNSSDDETGVVIELQARDKVLEPTIYNTTTGEQFGVAWEMERGDVIRINTRKGEKSLKLIRDGVESNIINKMLKGSKWFNLNAGDNIYTYSAAYGAENLNVEIKLQPIYEGV